MYTVYCLEVPDGRKYIGITSTSLKVRFNKGNGYRFIPELWEIIDLLGWDAVRKTVLGENLDKAQASVAEKHYIALYNTTNPRCGFNKEMGGINEHKKVSEQSRRKHSQSVMGDKNHNFGKHFSEEHRRKIAEGNRGLKRSSETCRNIGLSKQKPVSQYDVAGNLIAVYASGIAAEQITGIPRYAISKCCVGQRKTAGGYVWKH